MQQNQWLGAAPAGGGWVGMALLSNFDGSTHLFIASPRTRFINHIEFPVGGMWAWRRTKMTIPGTFVRVTAYFDVDAGDVHVIATNSNYVYESVSAPGEGRTDASPAAAAVGIYMFIAIKGLDGQIWINQTGDLGQSFVGWLPLT